MSPNIIKVAPKEDYKILLSFDNGEVKTFDMKPYIDKGFFKQLQDKKYFNSVKPSFDSIQWPNGRDLSPDTLYLDSY